MKKNNTLFDFREYAHNSASFYIFVIILVMQVVATLGMFGISPVGISPSLLSFIFNLLVVIGLPLLICSPFYLEYIANCNYLIIKKDRIVVKDFVTELFGRKAEFLLNDIQGIGYVEGYERTKAGSGHPIYGLTFYHIDGSEKTFFLAQSQPDSDIWHELKMQLNVVGIPLQNCPFI